MLVVIAFKIAKAFAGPRLRAGRHAPSATMSSAPEPKSGISKDEQIAELTVSFDSFKPGDLLPETTIAFDAESSEMPDGSDFPASVTYSVREEVGRGGMAKIFSAEDPPLNRLVAVKVSTADTRMSDPLFVREAEVLANLAHPSIPPIYSRGTDDHGRAFYSMKLIRGQTLQKVLKQLAAGDPETTCIFTLQRLLEIFRKVCDAVAFAHVKGYLHRDLKPENIMVGEFGEVLVMDWGLALEFGAHAKPSSAVGEQEEGTIRLQGTPQYMSPEQVEGMVVQLDERSDIYSLGGVLYAILTTNSPVSGTSLQDVLDRVRTGRIAPMPMMREVKGPSGKFDVVIPDALRAVTLKAMATDRGKRYPHVSELIADIEAYQQGFATKAEQAGFLRQLELIIKRNRLASSLVAILIVVAIGFTIRLAQSEKLSRLRAIEAQRSAAEALAEKKAARRSAAEAQMAVAENAEREGRPSESRRSLQAVPEELRGQEWNYLDDRLSGGALHLVSKTDTPWLGAAAIRDKPSSLIALDKSGLICSVDLDTGKIEELFKLNQTGLANLIGASGDGSMVVISRTIRKPKTPLQPILEAYTIADKALKFSSPIQHPFDYLVFNNTGSHFLRLSGLRGGGFFMCSSATGAVLWEKQQLGYVTASFSEDGDSINLYTEKQGFLQLDAMTGAERDRPTPMPYPVPIRGYAQVFSRSPSGDCTFLPSLGGFDLVDTMTGKPRFSIQQPPGKIVLKRVEADWANQLLFSVYRKGDRDGILEVHSARSAKKLISHGFSTPNTMRDLRVLRHPTSRHVVVMTDKYLKVWNIQPVHSDKRLELAPKPPIGVIHSFCFVEDGDKGLACLSKNQGGGVSLLDLKKQGTQETKEPSFGAMNGSYYATLVSSADGKTAAFSRTAKGGARELQICRLENGAFSPVTKKAIGVYENRLQMSPSGKTLWQGMSFLQTETLSNPVTVDRAGMNAVEEPGSTRWVGEDRVVEIAVPQIAESEDDEETLSRILLLWSTAGGKPIATASAPNAVAVAASPDASLIVEAGIDLRVRIRNSKTLKIVRELRVHDAPLTAVAWHPHLPLIATASEDHSVKIWDLRTDKMVEKLSLFLDLPNALYWSPDGKSLAVQHADAATFVDIFRPESCR